MMKIGVFDSGLGGLWVAKSIRKALPEYDYVFYGDQAHVPYGNKTKEELFSYTTTALEFLYKKQNCKAVLLACNTTSTAIYDELKNWTKANYPDRSLFGIAIPTVESVVDSKSVVVFATQRTCESHKYRMMFHEKNIDALEIALPDLASMIEDGKDPSTYLEKYKSIIREDVDTIVLGCTHYGIVASTFKKAIPQVRNWILQEEIMPKFLEKYINEKPDLRNSLSKDKSFKVFVTAPNPIFYKYGKEWFGEKFEIEYL